VRSGIQSDIQSDGERNIAIVRNLVQAMDAGDLAVLDSLCLPSFVAHFNGVDLNLAQVREAAASFVGSFPDMKHSIRSIEADGDCVKLQALDTATHRGPYKGIPATNLKVQFETTATYRIEFGKIAEVWQQMDVEGLLRQISAVSGRR
jgi:predicted ester cyclase